VRAGRELRGGVHDLPLLWLQQMRMTASLKARFRRCTNAVIAAAYTSTPRNTAFARLELGL
jgi:hypothetical protein